MYIKQAARIYYIKNILKNYINFDYLQMFIRCGIKKKIQFKGQLTWIIAFEETCHITKTTKGNSKTISIDDFMLKQMTAFIFSNISHCKHNQ